MAGFNLIKKHPGLSLLIVFETLLFILVAYQVQVNERLSLLERMALNVFGPIQELNNTAVSSVSDYFDDQKTRVELLEENQKLKEALQGFEQLKSHFEESERENDQFRQLLSLHKEENWIHITARVIGKTRRHQDYMITINKGLKYGIEKDMGVFDQNGVIGVVWESSMYYAKIVTINNPSSIVAALVQNSRYQESFVSGMGRNQAQLVNFPNFETINPGDLILTSGLDGIFPKGLPIGRVVSSQPSSYMFQEVVLDLLTDFSRLEHVVVLKPTCERDGHEME